MDENVILPGVALVLSKTAMVPDVTTAISDFPSLSKSPITVPTNGAVPAAC